MKEFKFITEEDREYARIMAGKYTLHKGAFFAALEGEKENARRARASREREAVMAGKYSARPAATAIAVEAEINMANYGEAVSPYQLPVGYKGWGQVIAEARRNNRVVLREDHGGFIRRRLTAKDCKQFAVSMLIGRYDAEKDESEFIPLAIELPAGIETGYLEKVISPAFVRVDPLGYDEVERFSYCYLKYQVSNAMDLYPLTYNQKIYRLIERNAEGKATREDFFSLVETEEGVELFNYLTGEYHSPYLILDEKGRERRFRRDGELKKLGIQVVVYSPAAGTSTNGEEKQGTYCFSAQNLPGFYPWRHVNRMTHGAYRLLKKAYANKELTAKEFAQLATRMAQFKAPMAPLSRLHGVAIDMRKWKDSKGNDAFDGWFKVATEYIAESASGEDFLVLPEAVDGNVGQSRPLIMSKGLASFLPRKHILEEIKETGRPVYFIFQDEVGYSARRDAGRTQAAFNEAVLSKAGIYSDGIVVIMPSRFKEDGELFTDEELLNQIDVFEDLNVFKTIVDLRYPIGGLNLLEMGHSEEDLEDEANTSNQLLQSAMVADPRAASAFIQKRARASLDSVVKAHVEGEGRALHAGELQGSLQQAMPIAFPDFCRTIWSPVYQDTLNKAVEGWSNRMGKLSTLTDGVYAKIIPDISHWLTGDLSVRDLLRVDRETGEVEIACVDLELQKVRRAVGVKYPKMGFQEYGRFKAVYREELIERAEHLLDEGIINKAQFRRLKHQIKHLRPGTVMVPAVEELKDMLAGMDFDGDALILYTDPELVDIVWGITPVAVQIVKNNDEFEFANPEDSKAWEYLCAIERGETTAEASVGIVE